MKKWVIWHEILATNTSNSAWPSQNLKSAPIHPTCPWFQSKFRKFDKNWLFVTLNTTTKIVDITTKKIKLHAPLSSVVSPPIPSTKHPRLKQFSLAQFFLLTPTGRLATFSAFFHNPVVWPRCWAIVYKTSLNMATLPEKCSLIFGLSLGKPQGPVPPPSGLEIGW